MTLTDCNNLAIIPLRESIHPVYITVLQHIRISLMIPIAKGNIQEIMNSDQ